MSEINLTICLDFLVLHLLLALLFILSLLISFFGLLLFLFQHRLLFLHNNIQLQWGVCLEREDLLLAQRSNLLDQVRSKLLLQLFAKNRIVWLGFVLQVGGDILLDDNVGSVNFLFDVLPE